MRIVWAVVCLLALSAQSARALNFFELEVYPATTEGKGLHELSSLSTFVANGRTPSEEEREGEEPIRHRLFRTSLEYNYGLTDKVDIAAYIDLQHENSQEFEYAGSRFRMRGSFWEKGRFPIDLGWYVEAELPHNTESDLEFDVRPILSRDFGKLSIDLNPGFELPTVSEERRTLEFNYSARAYYRLSPVIAPAIELYGGIGQIRDVDASREQEHYVFPVVYGKLFDGLKLAVGPGFGLSRGSDKVILKAQIEWEFTVGGGGVSPAPNSPTPY
jgi:hypothetical protein